MAGGRPPNLFSREDAEELGKDLLEWIESKDGKETLFWVDWYYNKHKMFREDWKALIQRSEFLPYYNLARQKLTKNIIFNDRIAQSYGNRYLARYDDELLEHEESVRDRDAQRGKEVKQTINVEQLNSLAACLERFSQKKQISEDKVDEEDHSESPPSLEHDPVASRDP